MPDALVKGFIYLVCIYVVEDDMQSTHEENLCNNIESKISIDLEFVDPEVLKFVKVFLVEC